MKRRLACFLHYIGRLNIQQPQGIGYDLLRRRYQPQSRFTYFGIIRLQDRHRVIERVEHVCQVIRVGRHYQRTIFIRRLFHSSGETGEQINELDFVRIERIAEICLFRNSACLL